MTGGNGKQQQIAMQRENNTACLAPNINVAYGPAMGFTLHILVNVCQETNKKYWLVHIVTKTDLITDFSSWLETGRAED